MNKSSKENKIIKLIPIFILIVATLFQIRLIFNNSIWCDEVFTMLTIDRDWGAFLAELAADVHPPLYYIIVKLFSGLFGYNLLAAKICSIIPTVLMNILVIVLTFKDKEKSNDKINFILLSLFIIITTLTYNFLYVSLEVRMYSWALFFVTASGIYGYKIIKDPSIKNIAIFILAGLAAALTHYYALIMEVFIYLYLFIALLKKDKKNFKIILAISLITIIGYSWWLPIAIGQFTRVSSNYWIEFNIKDICIYILSILSINRNVFKNYEMLTMLALLVLCIHIIYKLLKKQINEESRSEIIFALLSISVVFMMIIFGTILNIVVRPMFYQRYMIPALGLFWLGVLILLKHTNYRKIIICISFILVIIISIISCQKVYNEELKTGTEATLNFLESNVGKDDYVISNVNWLATGVLRYYMPDSKVIDDYRVNVSDLKILWYFEFYESDFGIIKDAFKESGYKVELVYSRRF